MPVFNKLIYDGTEYTLWWGNIWEPLNLTVTTSWLDATITWEDNEIWTIPPTTFQKSELVRKIGSAPTSPSDWDLVVTETVKDTYKVSWYVDQWLTDWETYYYRVFSYSDLWWISYCDAVSVTISGGRQPTNAIAYLPLNTTNWLTDLEWLLVNSSWLTPTFWTYTSANVDCAYFNGTAWVWYSDTVTRPTDFTVSMWVYVEWIWPYEARLFDSYNSTLQYRARWEMTLDAYNPKKAFRFGVGSDWPYTAAGQTRDARHNYVWVYDWTNWTMSIYLDWQLSNSQSCQNLWSWSVSDFTIWDDYWRNNDRLLKWYLSKFCIINWAWSASDVATNYNDTCNEYGLTPVS